MAGAKQNASYTGATLFNPNYWSPLQFLEQRRRCHGASRSAAAISLAYIIVVTPWAIQQVITSTTRTTVVNSNASNELDEGQEEPLEPMLLTELSFRGTGRLELAERFRRKRSYFCMQPPPFVDFLTSWLATSHNFISPLIFWTLNSHFRTATLRFFITKAITTYYDSWTTLDYFMKLYLQILCRPLPLRWDFDSEPNLQSRGGARNTAANGI